MKLFFNIVILTLVAGIPVYGISHAQLLEKIENLEKKINQQDDLKAEIEILKEEIEFLRFAQEESGELDDGVKSYTGGLTFGGYVDVEYSHRNDGGKSAASDFDQHRFIFDVSADLGPRMKFVSELEFEHAGSEIGMEQAYLDYKFNDSIGARAGSILVPVGRFNFLHDSPLRELTERPKVNRIIVPTTWFDIGAGLFGEGGSNKYPLSWELYVMNGLQDDQDKLSSATGLRGLRKKGKSGGEETHNKALTGRVGISLNEDTLVGLSFYQTDVGAYTAVNGALQGQRDLSMWAVDWERQLNSRLEWIGEYVSGEVDPNLARNTALGDAGYDFSGWYSQLNYILDDDEKYRAVFRWGETDTAESLTNGGDITERVLGFSYRPNSNAVLKIEYHWEDEMTAAGTEVDNNGLVLGAATYF